MKHFLTNFKKSKPLVSWALYDFANTIFSAVVLTVYFPLYLTGLTGVNRYLGIATTLSMILAGSSVPFFGALSDQTGKAKSYLIRSTLCAIFFLCLLTWLRNPYLLITAFLAACFFFHAAIVFYNTLLVVAAPSEKHGFASGLGTGLGYLGVVVSLPAAHWVDEHVGRPYVFLMAAAFFLIFSLPLFFFVPERKVPNPVSFKWSLWAAEWKRIRQTLKGLVKKPPLLLFFGGNFFVLDALNSTIFWFLVYAKAVFHPEQKELIRLMMMVNTSAFFAGILMGLWTDRWKAMRVFIVSSGMLFLTILLLVWAPSYAAFSGIVASLGAFAISGIWTSSRKALIERVDSKKIGEYFGLYSLTTKVSVIGSFVFSIVADVAGFNQGLAVLLFPALTGFLFLCLSNALSSRE